MQAAAVKERVMDVMTAVAAETRGYIFAEQIRGGFGLMG